MAKKYRVPRGTWLIRENCALEAKKYTNRTAFRIGSIGAYSAARNKRWLDFFFPVLKVVANRGTWVVFENCEVEAKKYTNKNDFKKYSSGAYQSAYHRGWLDAICTHIPILKMATGHWYRSKSNCASEALKFMTRIDFVTNSPGAYNAARANGWLDDICPHMIELKKPTGYWNDKQICLDEAAKYRTRSDFFKLSPSCAHSCIRNEWLEESCANMLFLMHEKGYWTRARVTAEALKYNSKEEFRAGSPTAHTIAYQEGYIEEISAHMIADDEMPDGYWTFERCEEVALLCTSKSEFMKNYISAYSKAHKSNWFKDISGHMPDYLNGQENDAIYIISTGRTHIGTPVYKIGVTSVRLETQRCDTHLKYFGDISSLVILVETQKSIDPDSRFNSLELEKMLLRIGTNPGYPNLEYPLKFDGQTECRSFTESELAESLALIESYSEIKQV